MTTCKWIHQLLKTAYIRTNNETLGMQDVLITTANKDQLSAFDSWKEQSNYLHSFLLHWQCHWVLSQQSKCAKSVIRMTPMSTCAIQLTAKLCVRNQMEAGSGLIPTERSTTTRDDLGQHPSIKDHAPQLTENTLLVNSSTDADQAHHSQNGSFN